MQREEEEDKSEMMMEKISRLWESVAFWNNQIYYGAIIGIILKVGAIFFMLSLLSLYVTAFSSHL